MQTRSGSTARTDRSPSQYLALVVGLVFTVAGIAGFFVTGFDFIEDFEQFFDPNTNQFLLGLEVNPAHNVVHLVLGLAGLALGMSKAGARAYGALLFVGYAATFVFGLFAVENRDINFLSLNTADNWFHLASALVGLVIAVLPGRRH
ncbi:MAG: DUF4383 domain-containing protein [Actinomycetota bacterium]|nr:DUF4383 domain-containing protein [Actinomycetota bacterium]